MKRIKNIMLGIVVLGAMLIVDYAECAVLNVPAEYSTIQSAINASGSGDIVRVAQGTYSPSTNGESFPIVMKDGVSLKGAGATVTILDAEKTNRVINCDNIGSATRIEGFTITGGSAGGTYGGGIYCSWSSPIIHNNIITKNWSWMGGGGIYLTNSSPTIANNLITQNTTGGQDGGGICLFNSSPNIINNTIVGNYAAADGGGIGFHRGCNFNVVNTIITGNSAGQDGGGIRYVEAYSSMNITYSDIWGNSPNDYRIFYLELGVGCISADPLFLDPAIADYHLQAESPCIDTGDPNSAYNDPENPINPGYALSPSHGTIRNDMGAYGGPFANCWDHTCEYTLTVNTTGSGTVAKNPDKATYNCGDMVQLTANPNTGWQFAGWSGDLTGSENPKSITIDGNKTVTATFTQTEYTLTVNTVGSGTVSKSPDKATYHYGDVVQLTANPHTGWQFAGWSGDLSGSENPKSITIDGNKTVTATFTSTSVWSFVTIPGLPTGASLGRLWTDRPGNLYVWANTNEPRAILYHWNGRSWSQVLNLFGYSGLFVFGTGLSDVFASTQGASDATSKMYHYNGTTWTEQQLPGNPQGCTNNIVGEPGNVYTKAGCSHGYIYRYDGTNWQIAKPLEGDFGSMAYIDQNEIYLIACWGHYLWDGNSWTWFGGFDFCDVFDIWGMRDETGTLHLYAVGNNNFSNGIRVWQFVENPQGSKRGSWGCKCCTVFSDPGPGCSGYSGAGTAYGIWGSAPDDIYVTGARDGCGPTSGRVYHFNGTEWKRITDFGDIACSALGSGSFGGGVFVWGSGPDDVWVSTGDRLLHYGPIPVAIDIKPSNIPVAILSSATFDATTVDRSTVEFAGAHPLPNYCSQLGEIPEDVDGDGRLDIVYYFKTSDINLPPGSMEACITGRTFSGQGFKSCESICRLGAVIGDLNNDSKIDFKDFAVFASHWLECTDPNCG
jgi:uncharacterized repeat protein (TIGR02543 family)